MIVVFDFDGTLIKDDSFILLLNFFKKNFLKKKLEEILFLLYKRRLINNSILKKFIFRFIINKITINSYYQIMSEISRHIIYNSLYNTETITRLIRYINDGHRVLVISASPELGIRILLKDLIGSRITQLEVIGSKLKIDSSNYIIGLADNCYSNKKKEALMARGINFIDIFYTDSIEDMPVALMSHKIYLVDRITGDLYEWKKEEIFPCS